MLQMCTTNLSIIWKHGISAITEALERIEIYDKEWELLNPGKEKGPLTLNHLFGFPFDEDLHDIHNEMLQEAGHRSKSIASKDVPVKGLSDTKKSEQFWTE